MKCRIIIWVFTVCQNTHLGVRGFQYSKTCVKQPLSRRPKIGFQDQLSLNAGQKYCRMLPLEHSAILLTLIQLPFIIKIVYFVYHLSLRYLFCPFLIEWPFYTGFTVYKGLTYLYQMLLYYSSINYQLTRVPSLLNGVPVSEELLL